MNNWILPSALISIDFLPIHEFRHVLLAVLLGPAFTSCSFSAQVSFWWTQSDKSRIAVILVSSIIMNDLTKISKYKKPRIQCHIQFTVPNNERGWKLPIVHERSSFSRVLSQNKCSLSLSPSHQECLYIKARTIPVYSVLWIAGFTYWFGIFFSLSLFYLWPNMRVQISLANITT